MNRVSALTWMVLGPGRSQVHFLFLCCTTGTSCLQTGVPVSVSTSVWLLKGRALYWLEGRRKYIRQKISFLFFLLQASIQQWLWHHTICPTFQPAPQVYRHSMSICGPASRAPGAWGPLCGPQLGSSFLQLLIC